MSSVFHSFRTQTDRDFKNLFWMERKTGILPENMSTHQKFLDVTRGRERPEGGSLLSKPLSEGGRLSRRLWMHDLREDEAKGRGKYLT